MATFPPPTPRVPAPAAPSAPAGPAGPAGPATPCNPAGPGAPGAPFNPFTPLIPFAPDAPATPGEPWGPTSKPSTWLRFDSEIEGGPRKKLPIPTGVVPIPKATPIRVKASRRRKKTIFFMLLPLALPCGLMNQRSSYI